MVFADPIRRLLLVAISIAAAGLLAWYSGIWGEVQRHLTYDSLVSWVGRVGLWGPVLIVGLMAIAVVASPIPSAPIALASGAAYGHYFGTGYVVLGAELGAMIAFALSRFLGRDVVRKWFGDRFEVGLLGSQHALMASVFISRLLPFVSFDMISYAAGLSCLHAWRFALATLAGILPASFVLAHLGYEATSGELGISLWTVFGLGFITLVPIVIGAIRKMASQRPVTKRIDDR